MRAGASVFAGRSAAALVRFGEDQHRPRRGGGGYRRADRGGAAATRRPAQDLACGRAVHPGGLGAGRCAAARPAGHPLAGDRPSAPGRGCRHSCSAAPTRTIILEQGSSLGQGVVEQGHTEQGSCDRALENGPARCAFRQRGVHGRWLLPCRTPTARVEPERPSGRGPLRGRCGRCGWRGAVGGVGEVGGGGPGPGGPAGRSSRRQTLAWTR